MGAFDSIQIPIFRPAYQYNEKKATCPAGRIPTFALADRIPYSELVEDVLKGEKNQMYFLFSGEHVLYERLREMDYQRTRATQIIAYHRRNGKQVAFDYQKQIDWLSNSRCRYVLA